MERILTELTPECEITARLYAQGYEKKEIASMKCRAVSTVNNQLQKVFETLRIRNGRELTTMIYERVTGVKLMDLSPSMRAAVACCLLCVFSLTFLHQQDAQRARRINNRTETRYDYRRNIK